MTSTDPGNALCYVFCQNEYWETFTGKIRHPLGDQTSSKSPKRQLLRAKRFAPQRNQHFSFWFFFPPSFFSHLFPNLFDRISSLSIRVSAPQIQLSNAPPCSQTKPSGPCVLHFKQSKRQEAVWTENQCMAAEYSIWKKMLFLAIIKKENHNRHYSWLPHWIFCALYTSKDSWFLSEMKHTEEELGNIHKPVLINWNSC